MSRAALGKETIVSNGLNQKYSLFVPDVGRWHSFISSRIMHAAFSFSVMFRDGRP